MGHVLHKLLNRVTRRVAIDLGWARRRFNAQHGRICVLTYHGIVPDEMIGRPWVPSQAVSASQFARHMAMLAEFGPVRPLGEALRRVQVNPDEPPAVCVTFDDGLADNVTLAFPILRGYGHRATFFLATGYIGPEQYLPNDMIRLLRPLHAAGQLHHVNDTVADILNDPKRAKTLRHGSYAADLAALWYERMYDVDQAGRECLRMMTWPQVLELGSAGMEIGAHTVHHVILGRESHRRRRDEIVESVARVRSKTGASEVPFAYPNGLPDDYESFDVELLRAIDVPYAVTERPGWTDVTTPVLELHRNCIGRHCSDRAFLAQVFGLSHATATATA
jgi:peptidoglycan/xylan/chitin deacetylase (PgdA/CDA1 family)